MHSTKACTSAWKGAVPVGLVLPLQLWHTGRRFPVSGRLQCSVQCASAMQGGSASGTVSAAGSVGTGTQRHPTVRGQRPSLEWAATGRSSAPAASAGDVLGLAQGAGLPSDRTAAGRCCADRRGVQGLCGAAGRLRGYVWGGQRGCVPWVPCWALPLLLWGCGWGAAPHMQCGVGGVRGSCIPAALDGWCLRSAKLAVFCQGGPCRSVPAVAVPCVPAVLGSWCFCRASSAPCPCSAPQVSSLHPRHSPRPFAAATKQCWQGAQCPVPPGCVAGSVPAACGTQCPRVSAVRGCVPAWPAPVGSLAAGCVQPAPSACPAGCNYSLHADEEGGRWQEWLPVPCRKGQGCNDGVAHWGRAVQELGTPGPVLLGTCLWGLRPGGPLAPVPLGDTALGLRPIPPAAPEAAGARAA
ncbi:uncharacterized protein LOC118173898 isoform X1 [Oxyura jamaicensis]|uniref:uncharacterized protein LOC118173898 isoform X1 n=1 Tax=Oxyura jamaicensis TaxID=8884 RepID=UPI0015A6608A|nr:uncharacterized protein LOC118173898 isoform X1 [Oxyura jamaicensis]